jgi:hypothetical protein
MNRIEEEKLAIKISNTLFGLCPSFSRSGSGPMEWHRCKCGINGSACTCVWHHRDTCVAGKWEKLAFAEKHNQEKDAKMIQDLAKVREAMNKNNSEFEGVDDRFEILDL